MALELSSLKKAVSSLERALDTANRKLDAGNPEKNEMELMKSGVIQNFEFTYELCWKFMKRWLDINYSESFTVGITRKQLFRYAAENLLITDFYKWEKYHNARNRTSHTYDEAIAEEIFNTTTDFLNDAKDFLERLEKRND